VLRKIFLLQPSAAGCARSRPHLDYADWTKTGPGLDSKASMDEEGMINIWVDMKKVMPDLPKDYARPVKEWGTDPATSEDCPPLNIVIFIVGSRGERGLRAQVTIRSTSSYSSWSIPMPLSRRQGDEATANTPRRRPAIPLFGASPRPVSRTSRPHSHSSRLQGLCSIRQQAPEGEDLPGYRPRGANRILRCRWGSERTHGVHGEE
jgi:hypothetical protein